MILVLGAVLVFGALFMMFAAFGAMTGHSRGVARSLEMLESLGGALPRSPPNSKPVRRTRAGPALQRFQNIGRRISAPTRRSGSGSGWIVPATRRVDGGQGALRQGSRAVVLHRSVGAFFAFAVSQLSLPIGSWPLSARLSRLPGTDIWLYNTATKREEVMQKAMADAIDLLTISVEAGLGFDAALQQVAKNTEGPLADEFSRVLQEMQIGRGRADAMRGLGERTSLADLKTFVGAMVQADSFGIPIGQVLRVQSAEIRIKRRQRAEEKAAQVPVKIMVPVVLFILPCLLVIVSDPPRSASWTPSELIPAVAARVPQRHGGGTAVRPHGARTAGRPHPGLPDHPQHDADRVRVAVRDLRRRPPSYQPLPALVVESGLVASSSRLPQRVHRLCPRWSSRPSSAVASVGRGAPSRSWVPRWSFAPRPSASTAGSRQTDLLALLFTWLMAGLGFGLIGA